MSSNPRDFARVSLAVLAGGEGSRMGFAKAEMKWRGRPILHALLEQFDWPGPTLLVTAPGREHPRGWDRFTREVADPTAGQGPLRGLLTALEQAAAPLVVVTAVDMPFVRRDHLQWIAAALADRPESRGVLLWQAGKVQPLPCAFRVEAVPLVKHAMESGRRSLHGMLADPAVVGLDAPADWDKEVWTNLNTPQDLESAGG
jgi:molybdopterin-guanine dinucleotide biosynthesis protein A